MGVRVRIRRGLIAAVAAFVTVGAVLIACDVHVSRVATSNCFADLDEVPATSVGLVLGCSEKLADGRRNLYFDRRIEAAARLYRAGKVGALIVSGDNRTTDYDEPTAMKAALILAGVPERDVYCDYAGFRTLDSVVRAEAIFGQRSFTVVSQRFHCERAVFLARARGLDACGFDAGAVGGPAGWKMRAREMLARCVAVADVELLDTEPHLLGPSVAIAPRAHSTDVR